MSEGGLPSPENPGCFKHSNNLVCGFLVLNQFGADTPASDLDVPRFGQDVKPQP